MKKGERGDCWRGVVRIVECEEQKTRSVMVNSTVRVRFMPGPVSRLL